MSLSNQAGERHEDGRSPDGPALRADSVTVTFDGLVAVDDVSLEVYKGEIVGLIGPNGAGKTTLVNVLTGFQRPDRGTVQLAGKDVTRMSAHRRSRRHMARTFQGGRVFGNLPVAENVELGAVCIGMRRGPARRRATELLERVGLEAWADRPASILPAGAQRRLGLARAAAMDPEVLLLDEPAAGLNEAERDELREAILELRENHGCAILLIEHDIRMIMSICDRLHVLDEGRTIGSGRPDVVARDPIVIAAYLGEM
jgi:branched-chain amino acid transport system ATP-binding protein